MNYFKQLLKALQDIGVTIIMHEKKQNEILDKLADEIMTFKTASYITSGSMEWQTVISNNLVEDSRDEWVMIDRKKAVEIVTINGKAEKTITHTRKASLTKEEKAHLKEYGIVLIVK